MDEPVPTPALLPCGCLLTPRLTDAGARELVLSPCRPGCLSLAAALALAAEKGLPVERREA